MRGCYPSKLGSDRNVRHVEWARFEVPFVAFLHRPVWVGLFCLHRYFHGHVVYPASRVSQIVPLVSDQVRARNHVVPYLLGGEALDYRHLAPKLDRHDDEEQLCEIDEGEEEAEQHEHDEKESLVQAEFA